MRPIFVGGASRSGTTVLGRSLGSGLRGTSLPELHLNPLLALAVRLPQRLQTRVLRRLGTSTARKLTSGHFGRGGIALSAKEWATDLSSLPSQPGDAEHLGAVIGLAAMHRNPTSEFWIDHTPRNALYRRTLQEAFPTASFVVIVRDPRDVLASQARRHQRLRTDGDLHDRLLGLRFRLAADPVLMAVLWRVSSRRARQAETAANATVVRYEDLAAEPEAHLRAITAALDLEFESDMLYPRQSGSSHGAVGKQERFGFSQESVRGGDSLSNADLWLTEQVAGADFDHFKYNRAGQRSLLALAKGGAALVRVPLAVVVMIVESAVRPFARARRAAVRG